MAKNAHSTNTPAASRRKLGAGLLVIVASAVIYPVIAADAYQPVSGRA